MDGASRPEYLWPTAVVHTRSRSRQSAIRVENSSGNFGWRLGDLRLELRRDGKR